MTIRFITRALHQPLAVRCPGAGGRGETRMRIALLLNTALVLSLTGCSFSSAKIAGNEAAAIQHLRTIGNAELIYFNSHGRKSFGSLQQLAGDQMIDPALASGEADGYRFVVRLVAGSEATRPSYEIVATPVSYGTTGNRSFHLAADGQIRAADKKGAEATAADTLLE